MSGRHHAIAGARWERTRRAVFERAGWRCEGCGRAGRLECDHIVPLARDPLRDPFDMGNLQALCRPCHRAKTAGERKRRPEPAGAAGWKRLVAEELERALGT